MRYLLDANIFIESYNHFYHYEIVPSFWQWLQDDKDIFTINSIIDEVYSDHDNLVELIKDIPRANERKNSMDEVMEFVGRRYSRFKGFERKVRKAKTDLLLVAVAKRQDFTVVTAEVLAGDESQQIKIPDVCLGADVECRKDIFPILREKGINLSNYISNI